MAIKLTSNLVKQSPAIPFLFEDSDLRGGFRVVSTVSDLANIAVPAKEEGMLVIVQSTMELHQLESGTFVNKGKLNQGSGLVKSVSSPLVLSVGGDLALENSRSIPEATQQGRYLKLDSNLEPIWAPLDAGTGTGVRNTVSHTISNSIDGGESVDFTTTFGRSALLIKVELDVAQVKVEAFGDPSRGESNPYTFKSRPNQLSDDGSTLMSDGTIEYGRRYAFVSNTEDPVNNVTYWKMTNHGNLPVTPTLTVTYTAIE